MATTPAAVNHHWEDFLPEQASRNQYLLLLMILLVPVIVKANLTNRDRLFHAAEFQHPRHHVLVQIAASIG